MARFLLLNGPNLNLLGQREPEVYGNVSLSAIEKRVAAQAKNAGHQLVAYQSNSESDLVDRVQQAASEEVACIMLNPAAFTHTSVALRDALLAVDIPCIEIHLSNIQARESFRHKSYFSDIARGTICGFGPLGYELALLAAIDLAQD